MAETAWRKDGQMHWLNTTPDSQNARRILDTALETDNLCRIGLHGYADTWAHQNFTGYYNDFNAMTGPLNPGIFSIGHAEAFHNPDWAALVWKDKRLINSRSDNKTRFLDAARHMLTTLATHTDPQMPQNELQKRETELTVTADLDRAIGTKDPSNDFSKQRITRYEELAQRKPYGQEAMKPCDPDDWMDQAVNEDVRGLRDRSDLFLTRWDPLTDIYTWKDRKNYKQTHWHRFQQAVKHHQDETLAILKESNLKGLELPEM